MQPWGSGGFGGYAGFNTLEVRNATPALIQNLQRAYKHLRKSDLKVVQFDTNDSGTPSARELNGFHLFVYNRNTDFTKARIGVRYNEHWHNLPPEAINGRRERLGLHRNAAEVYQPFVRGERVAVHDWQHAEEIAALKVEHPRDVAWGVLGELLLEFVHGYAEELQFILLCDSALTLSEDRSLLQEYFDRRPRRQFFSITAEGIRTWNWDRRGKLQSVDWEEGGE